MKIAPLPENERERLEALLRYDILDTAFEKAYDDLVRLAANICDVPIALISLVDPDRQWFKAAVGVDAKETSRDIAFCAHAILTNEPFIINDATKDERFADNPLVASDPHIRFYAGVPLITPDNFALGTLCAIDRKPRELSAQQVEAMKTLAGQVMTQLELRRTFHELQLSTSRLRKSDASKDKFITLLSRDLRTPFTNVVGFAQLLESDYATLDREQIGAFAREISVAATATNKLLGSLLQWSRVESGDVEYRPESISLGEIVSDAVLSVSKAATQKQARLTIQTAPDLPVVADRKMTHFLIQNLLSNAIKYSRHQGEIRLDIDIIPGFLEVSVVDHGVGMTNEKQGQLFSIETARSTPGTDGETGSGLGLLVGQRFAQAHGTSLQVQSEPGKGTKVSFRLPLVK